MGAAPRMASGGKIETVAAPNPVTGPAAPPNGGAAACGVGTPPGTVAGGPGPGDIVEPATAWRMISWRGTPGAGLGAARPRRPGAARTKSPSPPRRASDGPKSRTVEEGAAEFKADCPADWSRGSAGTGVVTETNESPRSSPRVLTVTAGASGSAKSPGSSAGVLTDTWGWVTGPTDSS